MIARTIPLIGAYLDFLFCQLLDALEIEFACPQDGEFGDFEKTVR